MSLEKDPNSQTLLCSAIPKQAAVNVSKAVEFYEEKLGFLTIFQMDDYAGVRRGNVEIHIWKCSDETVARTIAENTAFRINVENIEALYEEYQNARVIHPNGSLETTSWGTKEFTVLDLDGNGITLCESAS